MCMSLLRALDKTRHDTVLRCVVPPPGVGFAGGGGSGGPGGDAPPPSLSFGRVRLDVVPRVYVGGADSVGGGGGL